jgi:hypothetical protein
MITARLAVALDCAVTERGGVYTCTPSRTPQQIADALVIAQADEAAATAIASTQATEIGNLLTGAQTMRTALATRRAGIITNGQTLAGIRTTFNAARATYLALGTPTLAQVDAYLTAQAAYVTALDTAIVQNGTDGIADIDDLDKVLRGLINLVAQLTGSTVTAS